MVMLAALRGMQVQIRRLSCQAEKLDGQLGLASARRLEYLKHFGINGIHVLNHIGIGITCLKDESINGCPVEMMVEV